MATFLPISRDSISFVFSRKPNFRREHGIMFTMTEANSRKGSPDYAIGGDHTDDLGCAADPTARLGDDEDVGAAGGVGCSGQKGDIMSTWSIGKHNRKHRLKRQRKLRYPSDDLHKKLTEYHVKKN